MNFIVGVLLVCLALVGPAGCGTTDRIANCDPDCPAGQVCTNGACGHNRVDLNLVPGPTPAVLHGWDSGDGATIVRNALLWQ